MIVSAKAQGVDPDVYLRDLIECLPTATTSDLDSLAPANWAAAHKADTHRAASESKEDAAA